jgi:cation diffusion facilitator CzcD-associated flavoprotein CzcO
MVETEVVVVGGGAAGLAMGACLRQRGVELEILEKCEEIGDSWRRHYDRLHLHTDKDHSELPLFGYPESFPRYPSRDQVVEYLQDYARHFDLEPRLGHRVLSVRRVPDGWETETSGETWRSRFLVVASGYNAETHRPDWPGQEDYEGSLLHSLDYRNGSSFRGQRVLVVGFGNSGGEIAIDLHEYGARPTISVRGPVNVIPREVLGQPILATAILLSRLPGWLADLIGAPMVRWIVGDLQKLGLQTLPFGPNEQVRRFGKIPLIDVGTIGLIRAGHLDVRPGVERFTEKGVVFSDGIQEEFAAVILATGFKPRVDRFLATWGEVADSDGTPRSSGCVSDLPGLYFCGFYISPTGMLREIALEAERIADHIVEQRREGS